MGVKEYERAASSALLPFFLLRKPFLLGRLPSYLLRSLSLNRFFLLLFLFGIGCK